MLEFPTYPFVVTNIDKVMTQEFFTTVIAKTKEVIAKKFLNFDLELLENRKSFRFQTQKIYPCEAQEIVSESNKIQGSSDRPWTNHITQICVNETKRFGVTSIACLSDSLVILLSDDATIACAS